MERGMRKIAALLIVFTIALPFNVFSQGVLFPQGNMPAQASGSQMEGQVMLPSFDEVKDTGPYLLGKGDVVNIDVRNQPEFTGDYTIGPDGNIQYKFAGDVKAEGLTKEELAKSVTQELEKFVKIPEVSVTISQYRSKFIYVVGAVGRPGKYPMMGNAVSLRDALILAGLPREDAALRRTYVIKPDEKKPTTKKVDIYKLLYKGQLELNESLEPGDLVVVPTTVPSEINKALSNLLSPVVKGAQALNVYDLYNR
jgi:polysaccharide export outer membrane protein